MAGKSKRGRPSLYKPEYCEMLKTHFEQGFSYESFTGVIGVSKQTLYDWEKAHPEYLDAKKKYEGLSQLWWEKALRSFVTTGEGNATGIIFGLKNRAASSWRDKQEHDHQSSDGSMTPTRIVLTAADDDATS